MDFDLTPEQQALKDKIRDLVDREIAPRAADIDKTSAIPWDVMEHMADAGLFKFLIPEQYGGSGKGDLRALELSLIREELARGSYQADSIYALNGLGSYSIVQKGLLWALSRTVPDFQRMLEEQYSEGLREYVDKMRRAPVTSGYRKGT